MELGVYNFGSSGFGKVFYKFYSACSQGIFLRITTWRRKSIRSIILAGKLDFCQELLLLFFPSLTPTLLFHLLWRIMQFYGSASLHSLTGSHLLLSMSSSFYGAVSLVALSLCDLDRIATETKTTPTDNSRSFSTTPEQPSTITYWYTLGVIPFYFLLILISWTDKKKSHLDFN